MPEPTSTATMAAVAIAAPAITLMGYPLGLHPIYLAWGFAGAIVAIAIINSSPKDANDGVIASTFKRAGFAVSSALFAAVATPAAVKYWAITAEELQVLLAFIAGAGAKPLILGLIELGQKVLSRRADIGDGK